MDPEVIESLQIDEDELQEMMVIEIAFGSGSQQVDDVVVHWGDEPEQLAKVFGAYISRC